MTAHEPRYIYREEILRWAWWLHTILVVVWGMDMVVGGWVDFWHSRVGKIKTPKVPIITEPCVRQAAGQDAISWEAKGNAPRGDGRQHACQP